MSTVPVPQPEPAGPRSVVTMASLLDRLLAAAGPVAGRPVTVAVDGRSASGKTTVAGRLAALRPGAVVVHTDDVAWNHAVLDWADAMSQGVLGPLRAGSAVHFRPPGWVAHERPGAVEVPAGVPLELVEGVGIGRAALTDRFDALVWVTSDAAVRQARDTARMAAGETDPDRYPEWMAEENPFQAAERSWERATVVVDGSPTLAHDPDTGAVLVLPGPGDAE